MFGSPDEALREVGAMKSGRHPAVSASFVCPTCFRLFTDAPRTCSDCGSVRSPSGWPAMPFAFRGRYLLGELLERDAHTASFRARLSEGSSEAEVLVKVARPGGRGTVPPAVTKLLRREATMAGLLAEETEAFLGLVGSDLSDPPYLVFELSPWPTLRRRLVEQGPLPVVEVAQVGVAILHGLTALERHQLVHRALTPSRIFARRREEGSGFDVKIVGFGLTPELGEDGAPIALDLSVLPYASPEMVRAEALSSASDVFMVACLLWELATGRGPFPAVDEPSPAKAAAARLRALERAPVRPPEMPAELHALLASALSADPHLRCANGAPAASPLASLGGALERFAEEYPERHARELAFARDDLHRVEGMLARLNEQLVPLQWIVEQKGVIEAKVLRLASAGPTPEEVREGAREAEDELEELQSELDRLLASSRPSDAPSPAPVPASPAPAAIAASSPATSETSSPDGSARTATFLLTQKPSASNASASNASASNASASSVSAHEPAPSRPPPSFSEDERESVVEGADDTVIPGVGGARWPYALAALVVVLVLGLIGYFATGESNGPSSAGSAQPSGALPSVAPTSMPSSSSAARPFALASSSAAPAASSAPLVASAAPSATVARPTPPPPRPRPAPPPEDEPAPAENEAPAPE
jgi:serine/threonine protein kinase